MQRLQQSQAETEAASSGKSTYKRLRDRVENEDSEETYWQLRGNQYVYKRVARGAEEHVGLGRHCKGKWQPQERQVEGTVLETRLEAHTSRGEDAGAWHCAHTC